MSLHTALWRRTDAEGLESLLLQPTPHGWELTGTAIFTHEDIPCRLNYSIRCDEHWHTRAASVHGWLGAALIDHHFTVTPAGRWVHNGCELPIFDGVMDVDLNFSPSTNLLPIRRCQLAIGQSAQVTAAWLRFPEFTLEPLEQIYRRDAENTYHYSSADGAFHADITTDEFGLVRDYPPSWQRVDGAH